MTQNPRELRPTLILIQGILDLYSRKHDDVTCMQIGANDGIYCDPIHKFIVSNNWKSLLVEPLKDVFNNKLSKTYQGFEKVILENCAIDRQEGERLIYRIGFTTEEWALGLTSFNRENIEKHIDSGYVDRLAHKNGIATPDSKNKYILTEKVKTYPPNYLLKKHGFTKLNVLVTDTEGYDFEILKMMDYEIYRPDLILYESKHLSDTDFSESQQFLKSHGYKLYWQKGDTLAVDCRIDMEIPWFTKLNLRIKAFLKKL